MTAPAAVQGDYANHKLVLGRRVLQIFVEIPLEAADSFFAAFGQPKPGEGVPVVLARLNPGSANGRPSDFGSEDAGSNPAPGTKERRRFDTLPVPQQAGIICADPIFWAFLREEMEWPAVLDAESAAQHLRDFCGVESRSKLTDSHRAWCQLRDDFQAWKAAGR